MKIVIKFILLSLILGCSANSKFGQQRKVNEVPQKKNAAVTQSATEQAKDEPVVATSEAALDSLRAGNVRFVSGQPRHPHQGSDRRAEITSTQKPHTIVLSCSDSRVPPEIVFDQGLGDLFVVRTAGEVADPAAVASIEYAVEHLGAKLLLVMGHHSCGAVKAVLSTPRGKSAGSKDLDSLVASIRPHIKGVTLESAGENLDKAVAMQVEGVAADLQRRSKILHHAVMNKQLQIKGAVYSLSTGEVRLLE